ncbi:MAG TPA: hypothetical protein VFX49_13245 [Chloroflexota bacterium]|nr:hypothetical protein [Chloroflexota bacterium]
MKRPALRNAVAHYRRAALFLTHAETCDALRRAAAAFAEAGMDQAAARCADLRRQVEAGGLDDLPPVTSVTALG